VFQTFIDGFGVYGPLLSQVKQGFDQAIEAGLRDALDNSNLRLQLLAARQEQASATAAARAEIIDGEQAQHYSPTQHNVIVVSALTTVAAIATANTMRQPSNNCCTFGAICACWDIGRYF
jgi:hypothetical protein